MTYGSFSTDLLFHPGTRGFLFRVERSDCRGELSRLPAAAAAAAARRWRHRPEPASSSPFPTPPATSARSPVPGVICSYAMPLALLHLNRISSFCFAPRQVPCRHGRPDAGARRRPRPTSPASGSVEPRSLWPLRRGILRVLRFIQFPPASSGTTPR